MRGFHNPFFGKSLLKQPVFQGPVLTSPHLDSEENSIGNEDHDTTLDLGDSEIGTHFNDVFFFGKSMEQPKSHGWWHSG